MSIVIVPFENLKKWLVGERTSDDKEQARFAKIAAEDYEKALQALRVTALLKFRDDADEGDTDGGVERLSRVLPGVYVWQAWVAVTCADGRRRMFTAHALSRRRAAEKLNDAVYYGILEA